MNSSQLVIWRLPVLWVGIYCGLIICALGGCRHADNRQEDAQVVCRNLHVPMDAVDCERVTIDDYRDYYGVYFVARGVSSSALAGALKPYKEESQERAMLYLHKTGVKQLRHLKWGPVESYSRFPEFVGVWDEKYLLYVAVVDGTVFGYFESGYDKRPGPGPFN